MASLEQLLPDTTVAVIEGDQETTADADRIRATGAPAVQVNTGRGCHLDAAMIDRAFGQLHFLDGILFIENVGNLVCPAGFDLGEAHKVVIASVTEDQLVYFVDWGNTVDVNGIWKSALQYLQAVLSGQVDATCDGILGKCCEPDMSAAGRKNWRPSFHKRLVMPR